METPVLVRLSAPTLLLLAALEMTVLRPRSVSFGSWSIWLICRDSSRRMDSREEAEVFEEDTDEARGERPSATSLSRPESEDIDFGFSPVIIQR